jgi:hypothetical protein
MGQVVKEVTVDAPEHTTKCFFNGAVTCSPKFVSSSNIFVSGTGRGFETAPLKKHKRYAPFLNE